PRFFFSSRRRHTRFSRDWSSDVCSSDLPTRIGRDNRIHGHAAIGGDPQDKKFAGERTELVIGDRNVVREYVTINRGTGHGGGIRSEERRVGKEWRDGRAAGRRRTEGGSV